MDTHHKDPGLSAPINGMELYYEIHGQAHEYKPPLIMIHGGGIALQTAIRHPQVVHKLVLVSTSFARSIWYPEILAGFDQMGSDADAFI